MMGDMLDIQGQTKTELVKQTETLTKIDENVTKVVENAELAHVEIVKAESHQKGTGKCMWWILLGVFLLIGIVVVIILVA